MKRYLEWGSAQLAAALIAGCAANPASTERGARSELGSARAVLAQGRADCPRKTVRYCDHRRGREESCRCVSTSQVRAMGTPPGGVRLR